MGIWDRLRERRRRKKLETLAKYETLSDAERADLERLREEQSPLGRLAGARGGSSWARMVEREFKPPRR